MDSIKAAAKKFCDAHPNCSQCPIGGSGAEACLIYAITQINQSPEEVISLAMKWAKEHPDDLKTFADDFLEKFPSALRSNKVRDSGASFPCVCRNVMYGINGGCCDGGMRCRQCWLTPFPQQK